MTKTFDQIVQQVFEIANQQAENPIATWALTEVQLGLLANAADDPQGKLSSWLVGEHKTITASVMDANVLVGRGLMRTEGRRLRQTAYYITETGREALQKAIAEASPGESASHPVQEQGNIEGLAKHLDNTYGPADEGFFTRCMAASELADYPEENRSAICARAHKEFIGKWPSEEARRLTRERLAPSGNMSAGYWARDMGMVPRDQVSAFENWIFDQGMNPLDEMHPADFWQEKYAQFYTMYRASRRRLHAAIKSAQDVVAGDIVVQDREGNPITFQVGAVVYSDLITLYPPNEHDSPLRFAYSDTVHVAETTRPVREADIGDDLAWINTFYQLFAEKVGKSFDDPSIPYVDLLPYYSTGVTPEEAITDIARKFGLPLLSTRRPAREGIGNSGEPLDEPDWIARTYEDFMDVTGKSLDDPLVPYVDLRPYYNTNYTPKATATEIAKKFGFVLQGSTRVVHEGDFASYPPDVQEIVRNVALEDLKYARKSKGGTMITNTKRGIVDVYWDADTQTYKIMAQGQELYNGPEEGAILALCDLYDVVGY